MADADLAAQPPVAIQARGLTRRYGDFVAVDRLDLTIRQGEVFGLLGPNGAGKTTTILMLLGLSQPSAGTARVLGLEPGREPLAVKRHVGYLPDEVGFYGSLSGRQNLRYTARLNDIPPKVAEPLIAEALERVGLSAAADQRVDTYSRGMRQRLGLADVLVKQPSIVILDEPTTAIDPAGVTEVLALVRALADEGVTVLLSSHLLHQVQQICDRVGIFVAGKLVAVGRMAELARQVGAQRMTVELATAGAPDVAAETVRAVAGVSDVRRDEREPDVLLVETEGDVRAQIAAALAAAGSPPVHLRRRGDGLDEIYARYFAVPEAEHDRPA
ncbi:MAG TPA: ABC transporter ATP-binding protein [Candidatus Limnocylindria bacterium]|nr:ABC transporter ATP-binding protein [Candidatus Limnocylindria bacterium]